MLSYEKFEKSLHALVLQYNNYENIDNSLPDITKEAIAESVIQRFETCYDSMYKILKKYMQENLGVTDIPNSPKPIFRIANDNNLLGGDIKQWLSYADLRIGTSHDYSVEKMQNALLSMNKFIEDMKKLYKSLTGSDFE